MRERTRIFVLHLGHRFLSFWGWLKSNLRWNNSPSRGAWKFHGGKNMCRSILYYEQEWPFSAELMLFLSYEMSKVKEQEEIDPIFCSKCFFCQLIAGYLVHTHMQPFLYFFQTEQQTIQPRFLCYD